MTLGVLCSFQVDISSSTSCYTTLREAVGCAHTPRKWQIEGYPVSFLQDLLKTVTCLAWAHWMFIALYSIPAERFWPLLPAVFAHAVRSACTCACARLARNSKVCRPPLEGRHLRLSQDHPVRTHLPPSLNTTDIRRPAQTLSHRHRS